jgi:two-component system cell cycle response regulator
MASILVIEDSDTHRAEIRRTLEGSGLFDRVLEAADGIRGLKLMVSEPVDVILCDLEMPGLDGEKILRVKEATPGREHVPFLFLTASCDVERRVHLLATGACDALVKPFHPAEMVARLALHLKVKRLQDELRIKNHTLARLSTVDELTGLRSRRYVCDLLSVELLRARRYRTSLAVLMADLDHFKQVNDRHGHLAGDAVLRAVAQRLLGAFRATDTAGRYGGEELLVVLPQNTASGAAQLAERWRRDVAGAPFEVGGGEPVRVTLSAGVAEYRDEFEAPEDLIAAADAALYRAKEKGRNRVEVE